MSGFSEPSEKNHFLVDYVAIILESFNRWTGNHLIDPALNYEAAARELFFAPFAVMSHDKADDPVFNYANQTTLKLFEMTWDKFTDLPSRLSAEPDSQNERYKILSTVKKKGFVDDYCGVRVSSTGRLFEISNATIWNIFNTNSQYVAQAAMFKNWQYMD